MQALIANGTQLAAKCFQMILRRKRQYWVEEVKNFATYSDRDVLVSEVTEVYN